MELIRKSDALHAVLHNEGQAAVAAVQGIKPHVGSWVPHGVGAENVPWGYNCSHCGRWFVIGEAEKDEYHYCPNCGAKMRGEHDGSH